MILHCRGRQQFLESCTGNLYRLGNAIGQMNSDSVATLLCNCQKGATRLVLNEP